jgi:hypothetical protein
MQEFASVSSSSYDPAALAAKLTEKSADGWSVVGIVPTGGDVTAFICRELASSGGGAAVAATPDTAAAPEPSPVVAVEAEPTAVAAAEPAPAQPAPTPVTPEPAGAVVAEPAGWAIAPEPANSPMAPISEPAPVQATAATYQPTAPTTPAVPAGWYADPAARFELRYWDGSTWTEHVSRAGQQFTDPPVA